MLGLVLAILLAGPVAAPPASAGTVAAGTLLVGEGWGCAIAIADQTGGAWQCWAAAPPASNHAISAWRVPWMEGARWQAGPDRLCTMEGEAVRCFHPPRRGEASRRPIGDAVGGGGAPTNGRERSYDKSALYEDLVGGTFECPSRRNDIWCAGDNSFGQLGWAGNVAAVPPMLKLWIVENVGLGTWHGCAWRDGGPPADHGLYCWGRGDAGQLGFPGPDVCRVDGKDVPCARKPMRVPFDLYLPGLGYAPNRGKGDLRGGDLFTCARDVRGSEKEGRVPGIVCWGASRDGLFGSAALCPSGLTKAWPTRRGGTIAAPAATCSPTPAVIAGSDRFMAQRGPLFNGVPTRPLEVTDKFDVGPRGICMVSERGEIWCKGAIAAPRKLAVDSVVVSSGEDASACAVTKDRRLWCWGEGYSPSNARDTAVPFVFETLPPPPVNPNPAPMDTPAGAQPWGKTCLIHRTCEPVARVIAPCAKGATGLTADAVASLPADGRVVSVQGPLGAGFWFTTGKGCFELDPVTEKRLPVRACCNGTTRAIQVGDASPVVLGGVRCAGDESRVCCDLVVRGQTVIATGKLQPNPNAFGSQPVMRLDDAKICALDEPAADRGTK